MFRLLSLCVVTMVASLLGCATAVEPIALRTSETPQRVNAAVMRLTNTVLKLPGENTVLREQVSELTEMLVESELSRTNHLVPAADSGTVSDNE
jgi:hypothetical protein